VPATRVDKVRSLVDACHSLLVVGSSLQVYSGYRIVDQAKSGGKAVAILNIGETRGDKLADVIVRAKAGDVLASIAFKS